MFALAGTFAALTSLAILPGFMLARKTRQPLPLFLMLWQGSVPASRSTVRKCRLHLIPAGVLQMVGQYAGLRRHFERRRLWCRRRSATALSTYRLLPSARNFSVLRYQLDHRYVNQPKRSAPGKGPCAAGRTACSGRTVTTLCSVFIVAPASAYSKKNRRRV